MKADRIRQITIKAVTEGFDKARGDLKGLTQEQLAVASGADAMAVATDRAAKKQLAVAARYRQQSMQVDEVFRSQERLKKELKLVDDMRRQEGINDAQAAERKAVLIDRYGQVTTATSRMTRGMSSAGDESAAASHRMIVGLSGAGEAAEESAKQLKQANVQTEALAKQARVASANMITGMTAAGDVGAVASQRMISGMSASTKVSEQAVKQFDKMVVGMTAAGDVGAVASHRMLSGMSAAGKAAEEAAKQTGKIVPQATAAAKAIGLTQYETLNLSRQLADVGVSLAGGQSPFVVITQQGAQIIDIFQGTRGTVRGFFEQAIGWAGRFVTSTAGIVSGIGAVAGGVLFMASSWQEGQREIDKALVGIGKRAGATRGEINQMAEASADAAKLSASEWAVGAAEFAKTGTIYKENFKGLNELVKGFAATIGESSDEAQKQLAKIFGGDVTDAVDQLNRMYGSISGRTREYVRDLEVAGKRQEAIAVIVQDVSPTIRDAQQVTGFWAASWDAVARAASNAATAIGKAGSAMTGIGDTREARLARLEDTLRVAEGGLAQQRETAGQIGPDLVPGLKAAEAAVAELKRQVAALKEEMGKVNEDQTFLKIGQDADAAVRATLPYLEQLKEIEAAQQRIRKGSIQQHPDEGPGTQRGLSAHDAEANRALEIRKNNIAATAEQTDRANQVALQLMQTYKTNNVEVAKTLDLQRTQIGVASAVGAQQQLAAQQVHRENELRLQGVGLQDRIRIAAGEREQQQAMLIAGAQSNLNIMKFQEQVARAVTGEEKIKAEAAATYQTVLQQTGSAAMAAATAAQQETNARAQVNAQAQNTLLSMRDQLAVAEATTGRERILAEGRATYNSLIRQSVDSTLAQQIATTQIATAQAQATAQVEQQTRALNDQTAMIYAKLQGTEASVAAEIAYKNAIDAGASAMAAANAADAAYENVKAQKHAERINAEKQAMQQAIQQQAQANQMVADRIYSLQKERALVGVHNPYERARILAQHAYNDAIRAGASATMAAALEAETLATEMAKAAEAAAEVARQQAKAAASKAGYDTSQVGPGGYISSMGESPAEYMKKLQAKQQMGGYTIEDNPAWGLPYQPEQIIVPGLERTIDEVFKKGGSVSQAIDKILMETTEPKRFGFGPPEAKGLASESYTKLSETAGILKRLVDTLPKGEQEQAIAKQIDVLQRLPETMMRNDLIKQLNDQLEQLRKATEENTEALEATLDPLFSQGHEFINSLKIGYYKAARGLTAVVGGYGGTDSQRVVMDLTPGELIQVTPPGQQPAIGPANDNSRNVTQNITINIEGGDTPADRLTARQRAQGFIKAATMAAG